MRGLHSQRNFVEQFLFRSGVAPRMISSSLAQCSTAHEADVLTRLTFSTYKEYNYSLDWSEQLIHKWRAAASTEVVELNG
jgi:hypothetical protein